MNRIIFNAIPKSLQEFTALPQAAMSTPFDTAAMTVLALCVYPLDKSASLEMLDYLRGPRPMTRIDKQFIADRFSDKDYVPRSYFHGANPGNNYQVEAPYIVEVQENPYSYAEANMAKLFIASGDADTPRPISLRLAKDGKWYLWEQSLLVGIRMPEEQNPWA